VPKPVDTRRFAGLVSELLAAGPPLLGTHPGKAG
jgi:hypothetical protein